MQLPDYDAQVSLGSWIAFMAAYGRELDAWLGEILAMPSGPFQDLELAAFNVERAYCLAAHYAGDSHLGMPTGLPLEHVKATRLVPDVLEEFNQRYAFIFIYDGADFTGMPWHGRGNGPADLQHWSLPPAELRETSPVTFGQFIDAKTLAQDARDNKRTRWELIRSLASIFLQPDGQVYQEEHNREGGDRMAIMDRLPMAAAIGVARWMEEFNKFLEVHFPIFHPGVGPRPGRYTAAHFAVFGWINFLKSIAITKVFDIPSAGLNSIECARMASCFDVLIYASEEKSLQEAHAADMEVASRTK